MGEPVKKTILVTGGAGFLGSHLCDRFLRDDYAVIAMDNLITGSTDNLSHLAQNEVGNRRAHFSRLARRGCHADGTC